MKRLYLNICVTGLLALAGCGTKSSDNNIPEGDTLVVKTETLDRQNNPVEVDAEACQSDEMSKVVRLLCPAATMYYDEETKTVGNVSDSLSPGYYHYQGEVKEYYLVCLGQDGPYTIPKKDSEVVTWTAAQGHGYVLLFNEKQTTVLLKAEPSDDSQTIGQIPDPDGIPEDAECLGVSGEWYKVRYEDKTAYVRRSETEWNVNCADACGGIR